VFPKGGVKPIVSAATQHLPGAPLTKGDLQLLYEQPRWAKVKRELNLAPASCHPSSVLALTHRSHSVTSSQLVHCQEEGGGRTKGSYVSLHKSFVGSPSLSLLLHPIGGTGSHDLS
jgi:hypothetical protein